MTNSLDLTRLLPQRYRDKTIDTLLRNLYNRHLSKQDTVPLFGYIGDTSTLQAGEVEIVERDLERQLNQLTPIIYAEHATEKLLFSWPDLVQKLVLQGVNYARIKDIFTTKSYNFAPPIDLDKFCNYSEYFWIGSWMLAAPSLPWAQLGVPKVSTITSTFTATGNTSMTPEYYVIERGALSGGGDPVSIAAGLSGWSDWSYTNLWIHREDAATFLNDHPGVINFNQLVQATRPIIEYSKTVALNLYQNSQQEPAESGTFVEPTKVRVNQIPMFDLYDRFGHHLGAASGIFYYSESAEHQVDPVLLRRVVTDENADFVFEHSLVNTDGELYFYRNVDGSDTSLRTIWREGPTVGPNYVKYDLTGTLINSDKFVNYRNYFWTAVDSIGQPSYNPRGLPEYTVIESSGTSGWATDNHWTHVSNLKRAELYKYVQAEEPIIEFNGKLELELLATKTVKGQAPTFKHYRFDDDTDTYVQIPTGATPAELNLNDAYAQKRLLARVSELSNTSAAILGSPEVAAHTFEFAGKKYLQGLSTGVFVPDRDGVTYGYRAGVTQSPIAAKGALTISVVSNICFPQVVTFTWNASTSSFTVQGSVTGTLSPAVLGTNYTVSGVTLKITAGTTALADGDFYAVEIKSLIYERAQLYVKLDGVYRTLTSPEQIYGEVPGRLQVAADFSARDGVWEVPPQLEWNAQSETRSTVKQGDLYYHFTKIISAQPGLVGSEAGKNNWRVLTSRDVGLGGTIKQYDGDVPLFVSTLLQDGVTPLTLIDFARESYDRLSSAAHTFVNQYLPEMLSFGDFEIPTGGNSIDPDLLLKFKSYFASASDVVAATATPVDDKLSSPFYDTTSSLAHLVVTLPYLGLTPRVQPMKVYDVELGFDVMVHHDGHRRRLPVTDEKALKSIVTKKFERSPGQFTAGSIGTATPVLPYKGQYWFKTNTGELFYYNVISDTGEQPAAPSSGSYSFNRETNVLTQFTGTWNTVGNLALPWTKVDLGLIEQNLVLALETELYALCPPYSARLDEATLQADADYDVYLQQEFERFGAKYNVANVYSSAYNPSNSLTWNYSSVTATGASGPHAVWQKIYQDVYGTARPDLQPWIPAGYASESAMLSDLITAAVIPGGTTSWTVNLWTTAATYLRGKYVTAGVPNKLSVNVATGALLGPYGFGSSEQLVTTVPVSASDQFVFGDYGPVEIYWRTTLNCLYSKQKIYYRLNPREYVSATWGIKQLTLDEYTLNLMLGQKDKPATSQFHGDVLSELISTDWINVSKLSNPSSELIYTVKCVSRYDNAFSVTSNWVPTPPVWITSSYSDAYVSITLMPGDRDFVAGDTFTIKITSSGTVTVTATPAQYLKVEGFNQIFVQYNRLYGQDLQISLNQSLFKNWNVKLGYRFGGMVNTDLMNFKNSDVIDESAFNIHLKENRFYNSSWINALRVQVAQKGSTEKDRGYNVPRIGPNGTPGEDYVFRIDNYNLRRPEITWEEVDTTAEPTEFVALDGERTLYAWKKYPGTGNNVTHAAPFLITGVQNLINFITGYALYLQKAGWRFDPESAIRDTETNRPLDYQLLIEQWIVQIFSGATAGSAFEFNPFSRKVHYSTPRGTVANLNNLLGIEQETVCAVLDGAAKKVPTANLRVFRQDDVTSIISDVPVYTLHLLTSEYEHVVLFEDYSVDNLLIFDAFLGQKSKQMFINGQKQAQFTGRIDFGGHFLLGDQMKRNIENTVQGISKLYDSSAANENLPETSQARALLGFQKNEYFAERGNPDQTEFRFWQGMISNKGTNFAIDAYTNSAKYNSAKLDEYWAYKVAEYGDARPKNKPELKVEPEDAFTELTNYLFVEDDDLQTIREQDGSDGFDMTDYDGGPYDSLLAFNSNTFYEVPFDPQGTLLIKPNDERRWFRYVDLKAFQYFEAEPFIRFNLTPTSLQDLYQITDLTGNPVRADLFEIIDNTLTAAQLGGYDDSAFDELPYDYSSNNQTIYRETGDYIVGSDPIEYSSPKFRRINHSTIQILDELIIGRSLTVVGYRPAASVYSPIQLYNYVSNTTVKDDVIWWDPARGMHHPEAIATVDYQAVQDPARYNVSIINSRNMNLEKLKPWGENEVGKVWWNQKNLAWKPYSDAKLVPDLNDRLAGWGALSDRSTIELYEWVKSTVPPTEYDGEVAIERLVKRDRVWYHRPVAWKHNTNAAIGLVYKARQPAGLKIVRGAQNYTVLKSGSFNALGLDRGTKIAGAYYLTSAKTEVQMTDIFGLAEISSASEEFVVGAAGGFDEGALFTPSPPYFTLVAQLMPDTLSFRTGKNFGQYRLSAETDPDGVRFIRLTHVASNDSQALEIQDTPIIANTLQYYAFDQLGVKISLQAAYGHADSWPVYGTAPTESVRKTVVATFMGVSTHEIYVRSKVQLKPLIKFERNGTTFSYLSPGLGGTDPGNLTGWIAWKDPEVIPADLGTPLSLWSVGAVGAWTPVDVLTDVQEDITTHAADDAAVAQYKMQWTKWLEFAPQLRTVRYVTSTVYTEDQLYQDQLTFATLSITQVRQRVTVYVNERQLATSDWAIGVNTSGFPYLKIPGVNPGDTIKTVEVPYTPSSADLAFDPEVEDDPLILSQFKHETPYVLEVRRDEISNLTQKNYYFWVKNKFTPAKGKTLSIKHATQLLIEHDGMYSVPQAVKYYNQLDGRPNRYSLLSVKGMGLYVRRKGAYKLRLGKNPTLRDSDRDVDLKNVHVEWKLLRPLSPVKLPRQLWDLLTNALAGENQLNQVLPSSALELYDSRNGTEQRYGFSDSQIFVDPKIARDTLKYTVLNTRVDKYQDDVLVPDYISYTGFDVNQLSIYLSTAENVRKFMSDLWRFAKPKQLNEIFFAVLEDAVVKNVELTDFFKTSFISLSEVRNLEQS